jgi:hypothetical protein
MALSRRTLLYTSILTAASATLTWPLNAGAAATDLAEMTSDTFVPHLRTRFSLYLGTQRMATVTLIDVEVLDQPGLDAFSLVFRAPRSVSLAQDTYTVKHAILGTFALMLVPVGREHVHYEAVFNRLRG